ncbi:MAG: Omp28-related outer membrane protein [Bacteroidia bacterium]
MKKFLLPIAVLSMFFFASCGGGEDEGTEPEKTEEEIEMERKLSTVPEEERGLFIKHTGTMCYYCGTWGWYAMEKAVTDLKDEAVVIAAFGSHSFAKDFISKYSTELDAYYSIAGYPTFTANGTALSPKGTNVEPWTELSTNIVTDARTEYLIAQDAGIKVSGAVKWSVASNIATVDVRYRFFDDVSGDYYATVWFDESGMEAPQSGYTKGIPAHHHALRAAATTSVFGEEIATGETAAETLVEKSYEVEFPEGMWNKDNVEASVVIFKKIGDKYIFVNGSKATFTE